MNPFYKEQEEKIRKTIEVVGHEMAAVRAGRANAAVLDRVTVDYYGTPTPLQQVASISSPEPRLLVITPWDGSILKAVEKAIQASDVGINPTNDGKCIRLNFPQLTEERRRELTKTVHKYAEEGKIAVRNIRRDALEHFKAMKKKSELTEDDLRDIEKELQDITDKAVKELDALYERKNKELMEV
jgi:ribosome recycling factor